VRSILFALLLFAAVSCYSAPQAAPNSVPAQNPNQAMHAPPPPLPPGQSPAQLAEAHRMEYDLNTLRSMLYQMKSDLSQVKDPAARSALLVDSQMWEWVLADMQRRAYAMRAPGNAPQPATPVRPEPVTPRGVKNPNQ